MIKENTRESLICSIRTALPEDNVIRGKYGDPLAVVEVDTDDLMLIIRPASIYFEIIETQLELMLCKDIESHINTLVKDLSRLSLDIDYADSDLLNDNSFLGNAFSSLEEELLDVVNSSLSGLMKKEAQINMTNTKPPQGDYFPKLS